MASRYRVRTTQTASVVAAVALTFGLAACGSSGKKAATGSGSPTTPGTSATPTGAPLVVGVISSDSGKAGNTTDQSTTVNDWKQYVNTHGGINGHPVTVIYDDDTDSSATAIQDAQNMIQNDHVVAILDASQTGAAFSATADAAKVPVISLVGDHSAPTYETDPNLFADGPTDSTLFWAYAKVPQLANAKSEALLYCAEVAACSKLVGAVKSFAAPLGVTISYSAGFAGSAPNYTAICLAAKQAGATSLAPVGPVVSANQRVIDDCAAQGYTPIPIMSGTNMGSWVTTDQNLKDVWGFTNSIPFFVKNSSTATLNQVMGSYLPHALVEQNVFDDWTGLQLLAAAAGSIPASSTPTTQDIYNGLYALNGSTLGGLSIPLTFHQGQPNPFHCVFVVTYKTGTGFGLPFGLTPQCEASSS